MGGDAPAETHEWGEAEDVAVANDLIDIAARQAYRPPGEVIAALYDKIDADVDDDDLPIVIVLYESNNRMWYSHTGVTSAVLITALARFQYAIVRDTFDDDE